jgi:hypothetical protein
LKQETKQQLIIRIKLFLQHLKIFVLLFLIFFSSFLLLVLVPSSGSAWLFFDLMSSMSSSFPFSACAFAVRS